jgi:hypothetical protein
MTKTKQENGILCCDECERECISHIGLQFEGIYYDFCSKTCIIKFINKKIKLR